MDLAANEVEANESLLRPIFPEHFRGAAPGNVQESVSEAQLDLSEATWGSLLSCLRTCLEDSTKEKLMQASLSTQGTTKLTYITALGIFSAC